MSRLGGQPGGVWIRVAARRGGLAQGGRACVALFAAALACGCASDRPRPLQPARDLHDPNPSVRAQAAGEAGRRGEIGLVPVLIELLDDADAAVRLTAGRSLADLTGRDSGYRPYAEPAELRRQVEDWRAWWSARAPRAPGSLP